MMEEVSAKSRLTTTLLAAFLGVFGIHRMYLDRTKTAIVMLTLGIAGCSIFGIYFSVMSYRIDLSAYYIDFDMLPISASVTFIVVGAWAFVDFIFAVTGRMKDRDNRPIKKW
jgi:TM2 domain-containing membrane protein YozV